MTDLICPLCEEEVFEGHRAQCEFCHSWACDDCVTLVPDSTSARTPRRATASLIYSVIFIAVLFTDTGGEGGTSQIHVLHRLLVLLFQVAIESDVLVNSQRFPPGVAGNRPKLDLGHGFQPVVSAGPLKRHPGLPHDILRSHVLRHGYAQHPRQPEFLEVTILE